MFAFIYLFKQPFEVKRDPLLFKDAEGFCKDNRRDKNDSLPRFTVLKNLDSFWTYVRAVSEPPEECMGIPDTRKPNPLAMNATTFGRDVAPQRR